MKLRFGVTGVGHRGMVLVRTLARMDDAAIVGLADLDAGRLDAAASEFGVDQTFSLVSEMVDSMDLDAVLVLTPDAAHHPHLSHPAEVAGLVIGFCQNWGLRSGNG